MRFSASRSGNRLLLIALLCLTMLPKALVPVGWMPSAEGLVVCGGWAPQPAPAAAHGGHHGGHQASAASHHQHGGDGKDTPHDRSSQPCAFAGAAVALDAFDGPQLAAMAPVASAYQPLTISYTTGRGLAAPPPPPTGPPLLA